MLFNSLDFALFLPLVFMLYWAYFYKHIKQRNGFLTLVSYVFYGWWDYRFLTLIICSTLADFYIAKGISASTHNQKRKRLLLLSIALNLGFLGYFKYANFFIEEFVAGMSFLGADFSITSLNIVLPVGISFYTFQTLSYTIDVYKGRLKASENYLQFAAYVSFFPQLVAGPIERATRFLPQFIERKKWNHAEAVLGLRQILWGFFKKMVIADNCAYLVNYIYNNAEQHNGFVLLFGTLLFAFQIYGDFSGYSDIAIGTARLFGFNLMQNFAFPYFSRNIGEFWRRWHISLSTWFRDYLYIPLGGSEGSKIKTIGNIFIIFLVSGLWHGASWNFLLWGAIHALLFIPLLTLGQNRKYRHSRLALLPTPKETLSIATTLILVVLAWVPFRAESLGETWNIYATIFSDFKLDPSHFPNRKESLITTALILLFMGVEWLGKNNRFALENLQHFKPLPRKLIYITLVLFILFYARTDATPFIYFQF